ncbi:MAG: response regulator transcription factor [Ignavibacteriae bacterium]|nr:response regulator transcription factor [Ignavibacteriota bacterium]
MNIINCILIDDEKEALDRLESLLNKFEFVKILAKIDNCEKAVKSIIEEKPNLVFIDVEMPRKSGFDIINEVRENRLNPKFIFVTGYNQYAIKAIKAAAFDFLLKPVDIDELRDTLNRFYKTQIGNDVEKIPQHLIDKYNFTEREVEIITYLLIGKSSQQIADELFISKHTVDTHRKHILEKTNLNTTSEFIGYLLSQK